MKRLISGHWHGLRILTLVLGAAVFVLAVAVPLVGWRLGIPDAHGSLAEHPTAVKPSTVLGIGSLGLALVLSQFGGRIRLWRLLPAGIAALIGAVTLAEYGFAWDGGIDQLLYFRSPPLMGVFPGRPSLLTATMLLLLGLGLPGTEFRGWRYVIGLASAFGLKTVAEGVETRAQLDLLRNLRCDYSQGFLHSRPLTAQQAAGLLSK